MCVFLPVELLFMMVRKAWHTVSLRSGLSLIIMPRVRATLLKDASRSTGHVQKPGSMVQILKDKQKTVNTF